MKYLELKYNTRTRNLKFTMSSHPTLNSSISIFFHHLKKIGQSKSTTLILHNNTTSMHHTCSTITMIIKHSLSHFASQGLIYTMLCFLIHQEVSTTICSSSTNWSMIQLYDYIEPTLHEWTFVHIHALMSQQIKKLHST
jgi:hypothetical protein